MADKSCESCNGNGMIDIDVNEVIGEVTKDMATDAGDLQLIGQPVYDIVKRTIPCPDCQTLSTPPKQDKVVEVMCPFCKENEGRYCIFRDKTTGCCFSDKCDNRHIIKINPNTSPELVVWARSKALELVEIDDAKIMTLIIDMMGDELSIERIRLLESRIRIANPLKLKPPQQG